MADLTEIIEDAATDLELPEDPASDMESEGAPAPDPAPDGENSTEGVLEPSEPIVEESSAVPSPAAKKAEGLDDLPSHSASGRENRIPHSRVVRITKTAVEKAKAEWEKAQVPVTTALEAKVKEYDEYKAQKENQLAKVAEFEHIMYNEPDKFITMITQLPVYAEKLKAVLNPQAATPAAGATATVPDEDMPQPDYVMPDGSTQYSMEGVKRLLDWKGQQVQKQVIDQIEKRFGPIEESYAAYNKRQAMVPQLQKQIDEARTWKLFNENEAEIAKVLQENAHYTLERAYQHVVMPKLEEQVAAATNTAKAERDKMRAELLKELKQAPRSTSAGAASTKGAEGSTGPKSITDIIAESVAGIKR